MSQYANFQDFLTAASNAGPIFEEFVTLHWSTALRLAECNFSSILTIPSRVVNIFQMFSRLESRAHKLELIRLMDRISRHNLPDNILFDLAIYAVRDMPTSLTVQNGHDTAVLFQLINACQALSWYDSVKSFFSDNQQPLTKLILRTNIPHGSALTFKQTYMSLVGYLTSLASRNWKKGMSTGLDIFLLTCLQDLQLASCSLSNLSLVVRVWLKYTRPTFNSIHAIGLVGFLEWCFVEYLESGRPVDASIFDMMQPLIQIDPSYFDRLFEIPQIKDFVLMINRIDETQTVDFLRRIAPKISVEARKAIIIHYIYALGNLDMPATKVEKCLHFLAQPNPVQIVQAVLNFIERHFSEAFEQNNPVWIDTIVAQTRNLYLSHPDMAIFKRLFKIQFDLMENAYRLKGYPVQLCSKLHVLKDLCQETQ